MVDQLTIQTIGVLIAAISVVAFVVNSIFTSRREEKRNQLNLETRQAQLLMQIYEQVNNRDFQRDFSETMFYWKYKSWDDYWEKYGSKIEEYLKLIHVLNTYNGIGTVLENRLVDSRMLYEILGRSVLPYGSKFGPMVKHYSEMDGDPKNLGKVQLLFDEMSRLFELDMGHKFDFKIKSVYDGMSALQGAIKPDNI